MGIRIQAAVANVMDQAGANVVCPTPKINVVLAASAFVAALAQHVVNKITRELCFCFLTLFG